MATLNEINAELEELIAEAFETAEENGGEIPEALIEALESVELEKNAKLEGYALLIKEAVGMAKLIKAEEAALARRRATHENKAAWLKERLSFELGGKAFETPRVKVSFRKGAPQLDKSIDSVEIDKVPAEFVKVVPEIKSVMKRELLAYIKANGETEIAKFAPVKYSVQVK